MQDWEPHQALGLLLQPADKVCAVHQESAPTPTPSIEGVVAAGSGGPGLGPGVGLVPATTWSADVVGEAAPD